MSGSFSGGSNKNSGTETTTSSGTSTTTPLAPDGWEAAWRGFQEQMSPQGFTPAQQTGLDWMSNSLADGDAVKVGGIGERLGEVGDWYRQQVDTRPINTLASLHKVWGDYYDEMKPVTVQDVTAGRIAADQIAARRGAEFQKDYQNPYMKDVVDTSLTDYDQGVAEARNALRAGNAGAFGNKRYGVAEGQFGADAAAGRGSLAANLRSGAFNTAAGLGMQDANRFLAADQSNQSANLQAAQANQASRLQAALANAANRLNADQFNNQLKTQRDMFDIEQGKYMDQMEFDSMNRYADSLGAQAGLGLQRHQTNADLAQGLIGAGGTGLGQNLAWLAAGTPLFGENTESSGTSTTNTNGRASSKGGGVSGIPLK